jgi:YD repeat-containing protein
MWSYDAADRPTAQRDGAGNLASTWGYDALGRVASLTDATGRAETRSYDRSGRLVRQSWAGGAQSLVHTEPGVAVAFDRAARQDGAVQADTSWWVFDRPIARDWLFILGVAVGVLAMIRTVVQRDRFGSAAFVLTFVLAVPNGVLAAGVFGGTFREYVRGRRGTSR